MVKGDQQGFALERSNSQSGSRSDQYGGHNLMLSHGYCSDGDSFPPADFTGDVAAYVNTDQNFSHDEFALDILNFGSQYKSYRIGRPFPGWKRSRPPLHLLLEWPGLGRLRPTATGNGLLRSQEQPLPVMSRSLENSLALAVESTTT